VAETPNQTRDQAPPRWAIKTILSLSLPAFLLGLTVPFIGPDEPRYAEVGREMLQSRDWITPTLAGYHWFEKPPLLYWLEACFYSIFGVNEFAARVGPALCGLATVATIWLLLRQALHEAEKPIADWCACIAGSTLGLITFSHAATTDVVVTLPITVAMCAFFVYDRRSDKVESGSKAIWPLILMYAAAGLALLAKGLIGIIFPPAIILFYHLLSRRWPSRDLLKTLIWGIPLTLAIAAIWYVPMYLRYGNEFISEFIVRQHFERFTTNVFQHLQPFYFYLYVLPLMTLPWLPFFCVGIWVAAREALRKSENDDRRAVLLFSLAWFLVPLAFFSASTSKLPGYVLPAVPGAIIMSAVVVASLARRKLFSRVAAGIAGTTLILVSIALITVFPGRAADESVKPLLDVAGERGYSSTKVLVMHVAAHNAEFYAAERLEREKDGTQLRLYGAGDVEQKISELGAPEVLVLVPKEYLHQLLDDQDLTSSVLAQNHDSVLAVVSLRLSGSSTDAIH
jgi:4-amino-4-deoxy-L-arabinose transferase-like glycosyltransferase